MEDTYDISIASSGEEAFKALKTLGSIDLMLLDMTLPGMSGMDVLKEMKRSYPSISVMMVTANKLNETVEQSPALGACEYLEKPFEVDDLLDRIKGIVDKNR